METCGEKGDEYNSVTQFWDMSDDDDDGNDLSNTLPDKANDDSSTSVLHPNLPQVPECEKDSKKDMDAMKSLLQEELNKRINQRAFITAEPNESNKHSLVEKTVNDSKVELLSEGYITSKTTNNHQDKQPVNLGEAITCQSRNEKKYDNLTSKDIRQTFLDAHTDLVLSMKEIETLNLKSTKFNSFPNAYVIAPSSKANLVQEAPSASNMSTLQQSHLKDNSITSFKKENDNAIDSSATGIEDEKKAAAVERSLNAANYLLQNWGFKNRSSMQQIKFDLHNLHSGTKF